MASENAKQANEREVQIERILLGSGPLFKQYGFRRVTMDDIARNTGMSKKTIYQVFPGKDALIDEYVSRMRDKIIGEVGQILDESEDIVSATAGLISHLRSMESVLSLAMAEDLMRHWPKTYKRINEGRVEVLERYIGKLEAARKLGLIRKDVNLDVVGRVIMAAVLNVANPQTMVEMDVTPSEVMKTILDLVMKGILTSKGLKRVTGPGSA